MRSVSLLMILAAGATVFAVNGEVLSMSAARTAVQEKGEGRTAVTTLKIGSPSFGHNDFIPRQFTCDGEGINPGLTVEGVPPGTRSLVLVVDDLDAPGGSFIHWVVFDIPPSIRVIAEDSVPGRQAVNTSGKKEYAPPCPPSGSHRYVFTLSALDTVLGAGEGTPKETVMNAMKGHVVARAELTGKYRRMPQQTGR